MLWASSHTRKTKGLFGKGLTVNTYEPCSGHLLTHVKPKVCWERANCKYIRAMLWASSHTRKTKGLFGKGLTVYTYEPCSGHLRTHVKPKVCLGKG